MSRKPDRFPYEAFVERTIKEYFERLGFIGAHRGSADYCDIAVRHPESGESWIVECKGETAAIGTDFDTCLGQLVRRMKPGDTRWGVGLPRIPRYLRQTEKIHRDIRTRLGIHWMWVDPEGQVELEPPEGAREMR